MERNQGSQPQLLIEPIYFFPLYKLPLFLLYCCINLPCKPQVLQFNLLNTIDQLCMYLTHINLQLVPQLLLVQWPIVLPSVFAIRQFQQLNWKSIQILLRLKRLHHFVFFQLQQVDHFRGQILFKRFRICRQLSLLVCNRIQQL